MTRPKGAGEVECGGVRASAALLTCATRRRSQAPLCTYLFKIKCGYIKHNLNVSKLGYTVFTGAQDSIL
jgi:hypothetical protein